MDLCEHCQADALAQFRGTGLATEWLGEYLPPEERRRAFTWAQQLQPEEFLQARLHGHPLGEWVASSVVTYFRAYPIDLTDWHTVEVFRGFLHAAALAFFALSRLLDEWQPDALVLFNGRMSITQAAFSLARRRGVRVLIHERPLRPGTLLVHENEICISQIPFQRFWKEWQHVPLTARQMRSAVQWLRERRTGRQQGVHFFTNKPTGGGGVRERLGLTPGRRLFALFPSSTDEFAGTPLLEGPFESQEDWIEQIVAWAARRPEHDLVIRCHPCLAGKSGSGIAAGQIAWFRALRERLPVNARLIAPEDPLSTYDLVDAADVGITYVSTVGLEMFATGKPVVTSPPLPIYLGVPGVRRVESPVTLETVLDEAATLEPSRENRRYGLRCIARFFHDFAIPFPLVSVVGLNENVLNYHTDEELLAGRDASLDRICGFLLEGSSIFAPPSLDQNAASTAEEDAFLDSLDADPDWLQTPWTESVQSRVQAARERRLRKHLQAGRR